MEPSKMDEKRLAVLKEKPNNPLLISLVITILAGVIVCCLIAKEASERAIKGEFANCMFFALLFLAGGVVLMWKQVQRIDRKLEVLQELLPVQIEEELPESESESEEEDDDEDDEEEEESEEEEEDEELKEDDDDDEDKNGKNDSKKSN